VLPGGIFVLARFVLYPMSPDRTYRCVIHGRSV
jgi:hypothetical protein